MKKNLATVEPITTDNRCDHCGRTFVRDSTLLKHVCEQKRRWLEKDKPASRIAYNAWMQFYSTAQPHRKKREYTDFIASPYYAAFVKFANYCVSIRAVNISEFVNYLLKNNIGIDSWDSDRIYTKYLTEYLRQENHMEACKRTIDSMLDIAQEENIRLEDVFKFVNSNKLCYLITTGHISPWVLYHSKSGQEFLSSLNADQRLLVFDYIDPEKWNIKFRRSADEVSEIAALLSRINGL